MSSERESEAKAGEKRYGKKGKKGFKRLKSFGLMGNGSWRYLRAVAQKKNFYFIWVL